ncbi:hypothetical protein BaRGS_00008037 [Batillaria attramentaria]|uniref:GRIP domain-containing protein n=1 Tax=Batillaria attramentaria TaxID=370345 RepID=A0ABD0LP62_9CAEN
MELEEQLSESRRSLSQAQSAHQGELEQLGQKVESLEVEKKELAVTIQSLQDSHKQLEVRLQSADEERTSLKQTADGQADLQARLAETVSERDSLKQEYESKIQQLQSQHTTQLEELTSKFESDNTNKVSEYKKRAEAYIAQVKETVNKRSSASLNCRTRCLLLRVRDSWTRRAQSVTLYSASLKAMKCDKDGELDSVEHERDAALEKLRKDYEDRLREHEEEHSAKIKQLAKDLNRQLMEKEREESPARGVRSTTGTPSGDQGPEEGPRERNKCWSSCGEEYQAKMERHQVELWETEERLKASTSGLYNTRTSAHKEEVTALMKEWNQERKSGGPVTESVAPRDSAAKPGSSDGRPERIQEAASCYDNRFISLTRQLEDLRERHKLEMAELQSQLELSRDTVQPLVSAPAPVPRTFDPDDPNLVSELQNMELHNMDLQAQLRHVNAELAHSKLREKDSQQRIEVLEHRIRHRKDDDTPPLSPDGSLLSHEDSALLREPTELEYLKNILYEYMMGKETQTLAKVIATVVRFSDEQTRNVMDKAASRSTIWATKLEHLDRQLIYFIVISANVTGFSDFGPANSSFQPQHDNGRVSSSQQEVSLLSDI